MGFPDDWTAIPWQGRPAPDGRRYRTIGNSMAVPVVRWVLNRLILVDGLVQAGRVAQPAARAVTLPAG